MKPMGLRTFLLCLFLYLYPLSLFGGGLSLWPLFSYEEEEGMREIEVLGPLFFWSERGEEVQWGIRPLVSRIKGEWDLLYPLGRLQEGSEGREGYFFPIYSQKGENFLSFLTFYKGKDRKGEPYWGLFPLVGTIRDKFGRDEVEFFLWPLYSRSEDQGRVTTKVLWPLLKVYEGERRGFDLFPFYGRRIAEDKKEGFFLWPLFVWQDQETFEGPYRFRLYFPFYAQIQSPGVRSQFLFPPFFHLRQGEGERMWELWPLLRFQGGEKMIFPLFREKESASSRSLWFLWPLYSARWDEVGGGQLHRERFFLLSGKEEVIKGEEVLYSRFTLWPLFSISKDKEREVFVFPYPIPLRDEGLERNLYPLFTILKYEETPQGISFDLLWGLIRERKTPRGGFFRIAFLLENRWNGDVRKVRLLMGLVSLRKEDGRWRLRLLDLF